MAYAVGGEGHRQATVQHSLTKAKRGIPYFTCNFNTFFDYQHDLAGDIPNLKDGALPARLGKKMHGASFGLTNGQSVFKKC